MSESRIFSFSLTSHPLDLVVGDFTHNMVNKGMLF